MIRRLECVLIKWRENQVAINRQVETILTYRRSLIHERVIGRR